MQPNYEKGFNKTEDNVICGMIKTEDGFINPQPSEKSYVELRLEALPSIGEQLDMLYWDKVKNTNKWKELIDSIKTSYPKD